MAAFRDKEKGTLNATIYYIDWNGKKKKKIKRGCSTKETARKDAADIN